MGAAEVSAFLTHLAVKRQVAASTQNQALAALRFLYKNVLKEELPWLKNVERAKRPARIPLVLTRGEVKRLLTQSCLCSGIRRVVTSSLLHSVGV
jgi:site-specific recombinase XerD